MAYLPEKKKTTTHRHNKRKRDSFYTSNDWVKLIKPMKERSRVCAYCGKQFREGQQKIGEHFKPRRLWPELQLSPGNIKITCHSCNNGKSSREQYVKTKQQWIRKVLPYYRNIKRNEIN